MTTLDFITALFCQVDDQGALVKRGHLMLPSFGV